MSLNTQVKLLRVLEESEFMRVGGTQTYKVDVRLIAATNKNLEKAVKQEEFRRDLYYRLKAITIEIPPLRKRLSDIPVLVNKFCADLSEKENIRVKGFSPEALDLMKRYQWPGNVRELRNFVETAVILNRGDVVASHYVDDTLQLSRYDHDNRNLPVPLNMPSEKAERELIYRTLLALKMDINEIRQMLNEMMHGNSQPATIAYSLPGEGPEETIFHSDENEIKPTTLAGMEREMIKESLKRFAGSRRKAARALQISERTLYRKIKEYGL